MSTTQVQIPKQIQEVINILRSTTAPQIFGPYFDGRGGMCAAGAIKVGLGIRDQYGKKVDNAHEFVRYLDVLGVWEDHIARHGGLSWTSMNEMKHMSFKEIADTIEKSYMEHGI